MNKVRTKAVGAAAVALVLAGCGSSGNGTTSERAYTATSPRPAAAASGPAVALPDAIRSAGRVRVATDPTYAPFEFYDPRGTIVGFDADVAAELGRRIGVPFELTPIAFDGIIPALTAGRFDVVLSGMEDNPSRRSKLDFVDYFFDKSGKLGLLVQGGNPLGITGWSSVCGRAVAVQQGAAEIGDLERASKDCGARPIDIKAFPNGSDAQLAVRSGRVAAELTGLSLAGYLQVQTKGAFDVVAVPIDTSAAPVYPNGIGVRKGLEPLRDAIKGALDAMIADGTYTQLLQKWGLPSSYAIAEATINGAGAE